MKQKYEKCSNLAKVKPKSCNFVGLKLRLTRYGKFRRIR